MINVVPDAELIGQRHDHPISSLSWVEWEWNNVPKARWEWLAAAALALSLVV